MLTTRGALSHDETVRKLRYLALGNAAKKWTLAVAYWPEALQCAETLFPDRLSQRS